MKNLRYPLLLLLNAIFFMGCTDSSNEISSSTNQTLKVTAENIQLSSRVGFDRQMKFYWSQQDKIGVTTDKTPDMFSSMSITKGVGTANATFQGTINGNLSNYTIYPFSYYHYMEGSILHMDMPASYHYTKVDADFFTKEQGAGNSFNTPMWSTITGSHINMKHLGSVFCVKLLEMPVGEDIKIVLSAGKQKINGDFVSDLMQSVPVIETTNTTETAESEIAITFSNKKIKTPGVFYFPVPVGTYKLMYIHVINGETTTDCALGRNIVVKRGSLKKFELKNGSIDTGNDDSIIESNKELTFDSNAQSFEIKISAGAQFTVQEPDVTWIHRTEETDANTLKFKLDENTEHNPRTATIKIVNNKNKREETVTIIQKASHNIIIGKKDFIFDSNSHEFTVQVQSDAKIKVETPAVDWLHKLSSKNTETNKLRFRIDENSSYEARTAMIRIFSIENNEVEIVSVEQAQKDALVLNKQQYNVSEEADTIVLTLGHNIDYNVSVNVDWIKQDQTRGTFVTDKLIFHVMKNTSTEVREGTITFTSKDNTIKQVIKVNQSGTKHLIVSPLKQSFDSKAHEFKIEVKTNMEYKIEMPNVNWISRQNNSNLKVVVFSIKENTSYDDRTADINFVATNGLTQTVNITQQKKNIIDAEKTEYTILANRKSLEIPIGSNVELDIITNANWIHPIASRTYITKNIQFNIDENFTEVDRVGMITFTSPDKTIKKNIKITQLSRVEFEIRQQLIKLYKETNGDNWDWYYKQNWCSELPINRWNGITFENNELSLNLRGFNISGNFNFSDNEYLKDLILGENTLNRINIDNCTNLKELSMPASFETLSAKNCHNLHNINWDDEFLLSTTEINLSGCSSLSELRIYRCNQLESLNLSNCSSLSVLHCISDNFTYAQDEYNGNHWVHASMGQLKHLNLANCLQLQEINCSWNQLSNLDISELNNLTTLSCEGNALSTLSISGHSKLKILNCSYNNPLTVLDATNCYSLLKLDCSNDCGQYEQFTNMNGYETITYKEGKIEKLILKGCTALEKLNCQGNCLKELDLSDCKNLKEIDKSFNDF